MFYLIYKMLYLCISIEINIKYIHTYIYLYIFQVYFIHNNVVLITHRIQEKSSLQNSYQISTGISKQRIFRGERNKRFLCKFIV